MPDYRLTIIPALEIEGAKAMEFHFETLGEIMGAKNTAADLLLFLQDDIKVMRDYSNVFIMEEFVDGEWQEYEEVENA